MNVVQILMNCVEDVSSIRIFMPKDLRPAVNLNTVKKTVDEVLKRYEGNVPCLDPIEDMKVSVFSVFLFLCFCFFLLFSLRVVFLCHVVSSHFHSIQTKRTHHRTDQGRDVQQDVGELRQGEGPPEFSPL